MNAPDRKPTDKKPDKLSWETFSDERIRAAYEAGEFTALQGFGKPIPGIDEPADELWWIRRKLRDEDLVIPLAGQEIRAEMQRVLRQLETESDRSRARQSLLSLNDQIRESNRRWIGHPHGTIMELDVEVLLAERYGSSPSSTAG